MMVAIRAAGSAGRGPDPAADRFGSFARETQPHSTTGRLSLDQYGRSDIVGVLVCDSLRSKADSGPNQHGPLWVQRLLCTEAPTSQLKISRRSAFETGWPFDAWRSDKCRYPISTITTAASTKTPMASASPPSDMMFDVTPRRYIGRNETATAIGETTITIEAERKWKRNTTTTALTAGLRFRAAP